jgi:predicted patatin/cPLA2 family phospholipase
MNEGFSQEKWVEANSTNPDFNTEEFKLHQKRFSETAGKYNKRSLLRRVLGGALKKDEVDIAEEEAYRDNVDFEKRQGEEFEHWEEMLHEVIGNLKKKRDDPDGAGKEIRPLLLCLGGGMRGPYGAGQVVALRKMGFGESFDTVVGISAGAPNAAYFLAGDEQVMLGSSIYYEDCTDQEFLNFRRLHKIMDVRHAVAAFLGGKKKLDVDAIQKSRSALYIQATNNDTNEATLIDAKHNNAGIVEAVHASMALPILYREAVPIDGQEFVDGGFEPVPVEEVIDKFNPTDIIVLPNLPFNGASNFNFADGRHMLAQMLPRVGSLSFLEKVLKQKKELREAFGKMRKEKNVNVGVMWPPEAGLTQVSSDPKEIKAAIMAAARSTCAEFGEPEKIKDIHLVDTRS